VFDLRLKVCKQTTVYCCEGTKRERNASAERLQESDRHKTVVVREEEAKRRRSG
jgi:hypothetical protein